MSVRDGSKPVTGLAAADFVLTDNDVPQQIQAFSSADIPVDVTLIVNTSGSRTAVAEQLDKDVQQIERLLRRDDALRLLRIDTFVEDLRPMTPVGSRAAIRVVPRRAGAASVHDALLAALVQPVAPDRHHLVVAITDALDTISVTTADRLREIASRSEALLQVVSVRTASPYRPAFVRPPFDDQDLLTLSEAAERTGGELRSPNLFADPDLVSAFKRVFDEFRQSYLLRYSPRNVDAAGWHEIVVSIPRLPTVAIHTRRGYYGS